MSDDLRPDIESDTAPAVDGGAADSGAADGAARSRLAPPGGERTFRHVLVNTAAANVTTSFLWFALTF